MLRRIVYTRFEGGVAVCAPSLTALRYMTNGGGRWSGYGYDFIDRQISAQAENGVGERAARCFVMAMQFGGCTDAEAYEIMRDRYCGHLGTAFDLVSVDDLPDRWFRNAWRRGHNGGPIVIDMPAAREVHFKRLTSMLDQEQARRRHDINMWRKPLNVNLGAIADAVQKAEDPCSLKAIWWERT